MTKVYKAEISELKRNLDKCETFFESTATLLYNQIRGKIMEGLSDFHAFFQGFWFENLNPPETVVHL